MDYLKLALFLGHILIPTVEQEQTQVCFQLPEGQVVCQDASTLSGSVTEEKKREQCEGEDDLRTCRI